MKQTLYIAIFCLHAFVMFAQNETSQLAEDVTQAENEAEAQLLVETLAYLQQHPLDINTATAQQFAALPLLTPPQINALLAHRAKTGNLLALYELQGIDFWDETTIRRILPFLKIAIKDENAALSLRKMLTEGNNELRLRWQNNTSLLKEPTQKSFIESHHSLLKFQNRYQNKNGFGFMAAQDAGEPFARSVNKNGFDFYSFHLFSQIKSMRIENICFGDFSVQFGQGLLTYTGYARTATGAFVTNIARNAPTLTPFTATRESGFFRGTGATIGISKQIKATIFAAFNPIDARLDTNIATQNVTMRSIQNTGYHREGSELTNKNANNLFSSGFSLRYDAKHGGHIALNTTYHQFTYAYQRDIKPYNQFTFSGVSLWGGSVDYAFQARNAYFFGETALSQNGGVAALHGALVSLDKRVSVSLLHRYLARDYQSLYAKPFGGDTENANGIYAGLDVQLANKWQIAAYTDLVRHDWLRFGVNAPSASATYFARLTYTQRKKMDIYAQFSTANDLKNNEIDTLQKTYTLSEKTRQTIRIHTKVIASKSFTWQSRGEVVIGKKAERGWLAYIEGAYKQPFSSLLVAGRLAYFDVNDYDTRIYALEKDVSHAYAGTFYDGKGWRGYLVGQYRFAKYYTVEVKVAKMWLASATDVVQKPLEGRVQVRWVF